MKGKLAIVSAVALIGLTVVGQLALKSRRPPAAPFMAESAFAALGGFRSIAAEVIWFRADRLQEEGRYVELAQLATSLTFMEPHTPEVWSYAAWNLAYNVSVMMATHEDRWRWVLASMRLLRDAGLVYNPTSAELYRELAWLFEIKMGAAVDSAAPIYREKWREIVADVRARDAWEELRMDREQMAQVERASGTDEWEDPLLSAMYWAAQGFRHARNQKEQLMLASIINQSQLIYEKNHSKVTK